MKRNQCKSHKTRLYGKRVPLLPKPERVRRGAFALRLIEEQDGRFAVVKRMRTRLKKLIADANCDSIQKEILAGRAIFLLTHLESLEVNAADATGNVNWSKYIQTCNALTAILSKLGVEKASGETMALNRYLKRKATGSRTATGSNEYRRSDP